MVSYIALIHKDPGSEYGVSFPDLPGCISVGTSMDDAKTMASEALALHIEGLLADGEPLPAPSLLADIMADRANRDAVACLIDAEPPAPARVRVNITLAASELARIDTYAEQHGLTRSGLLATAARRMIEAA